MPPFDIYYRESSLSYGNAISQMMQNLNHSRPINAMMLANMNGLRGELRNSTYAIVASQNMLTENFQHGFNSVNKRWTLDLNGLLFP